MLTGQPPFAGGTTYETISYSGYGAATTATVKSKNRSHLSTICLKGLDKIRNVEYPSAWRWLKPRMLAKTRAIRPAALEFRPRKEMGATQSDQRASGSVLWSHWRQPLADRLER